MVNPSNIVPQGVSNNIVPKGVSRASQSAVDNSDSVIRQQPNTRKEFKSILKGTDGFNSEGLETDEGIEGDSHPKSIFDLSARKDFVDDSQENLLSSDSTLNKSVVDPKTLSKFIEKPEFAQEIVDLSSIPNPQMVEPAKIPTQTATQTATQAPTQTATQAPTQPPSQPTKEAPLTKTSTKKEETTFLMTSDSQTNRTGLGGVLPPPNPMVNEVTSLNQSVSTVVAPSMQELIDKLVNAVYTMQSSGKTETVLTLKELGGAQVTITTYDTAKNEVNITFSKLTQATESLMQQNRQSLESNLTRAGVIYHMVQFTTADTVNIPTNTSGKQPSFTRDEDAGAGEQQQKKKK
jgi:hypothetical protein